MTLNTTLAEKIASRLNVTFQHIGHRSTSDVESHRLIHGGVQDGFGLAVSDIADVLFADRDNDGRRIFEQSVYMLESSEPTIKDMANEIYHIDHDIVMLDTDHDANIASTQGHELEYSETDVRAEFDDGRLAAMEITSTAGYCDACRGVDEAV